MELNMRYFADFNEIKIHFASFSQTFFPTVAVSSGELQKDREFIVHIEDRLIVESVAF